MIQTAIHNETIDWINRVRANSGGQMLPQTIIAVNTFVHMTKNCGVWTKIKAVNLFVSESLSACLTPLVTGSGGSNPWSNNGSFSAANLSVSGLQGNKTNFLKTGFIPTSSMDEKGWGVFGYITANPNDNPGGWDVGCADNGGTNIRFNQNDSTGNQITTTIHSNSWTSSADLTGYAGETRTGDEIRQFKASQATAHTSVLFTNIITGSGLIPSIQDFAIFGTNENGSVVGKTDKTISFVCLTLGMTIGDSLNLFNAIQTARKIMGGGYI